MLVIRGGGVSGSRNVDDSRGVSRFTPSRETAAGRIPRVAKQRRGSAEFAAQSAPAGPHGQRVNRSIGVLFVFLLDVRRARLLRTAARGRGLRIVGRFFVRFADVATAGGVLDGLRRATAGAASQTTRLTVSGGMPVGVHGYRDSRRGHHVGKQCHRGNHATRSRCGRGWQSFPVLGPMRQHLQEAGWDRRQSLWTVAGCGVAGVAPVYDCEGAGEWQAYSGIVSPDQFSSRLADSGHAIRYTRLSEPFPPARLPPVWPTPLRTLPNRPPAPGLLLLTIRNDASRSSRTNRAT